MEIDEVRNALKTAKAINFSKHFYSEKVKSRGIEIKDVETVLKNPDSLVEVEDQGNDTIGHKYALLFRKSNKYDMKIVISIKGADLNVITTHIQNIKRRKAYEKWLEMQK